MDNIEGCPDCGYWQCSGCGGTREPFESVLDKHPLDNFNPSMEQLKEAEEKSDG